MKKCRQLVRDMSVRNMSVRNMSHATDGSRTGIVAKCGRFPSDVIVRRHPHPIGKFRQRRRAAQTTNSVPCLTFRPIPLMATMAYPSGLGRSSFRVSRFTASNILRPSGLPAFRAASGVAFHRMWLGVKSIDPRVRRLARPVAPLHSMGANELYAAKESIVFCGCKR